MRSLVAGAVAAPWVVWALVRTFGVELPYPFVALVAFTPYAALSSWVPVAVGLLVRRWAVAGVAGVAMRGGAGGGGGGGRGGGGGGRPPPRWCACPPGGSPGRMRPRTGRGWS